MVKACHELLRAGSEAVWSDVDIQAKEALDLLKTTDWTKAFARARVGIAAFAKEVRQAPWRDMAATALALLRGPAAAVWAWCARRGGSWSGDADAAAQQATLLEVLSAGVEQQLLLAQWEREVADTYMIAGDPLQAACKYQVALNLLDMAREGLTEEAQAAAAGGPPMERKGTLAVDLRAERVQLLAGASVCMAQLGCTSLALDFAGQLLALEPGHPAAFAAMMYSPLKCT
eukprot:TRINITY_DN24419_c0_g1_i2.p1 TRINITY_DN24419_c0_g1~~TRINITY_DN24419_c0_g1_i2.p1  ORF type:complete len:231 (-),score=67.76 TRINITY_DN24419_c0_g1_i2:89-781(-)